MACRDFDAELVGVEDVRDVCLIQLLHEVFVKYKGHPGIKKLRYAFNTMDSIPLPDWERATTS